jgi:hypothetical protein
MYESRIEAGHLTIAVRPGLAPECPTFERAPALSDQVAVSRGPIGRIGPDWREDPAALRLIETAQHARWSVLPEPRAARRDPPHV